MYWENRQSASAAAASGRKPPEVEVPVAVTVFPDEIFRAPRSWAERGYPTLAGDLSAHGVADRVRVTGWVDDAAVGGYLAAADACLCLRWPTAEETSASWLRCLAAGRATVISDLAHLVDVPATVALRADLLDEAASLEHAMRQLIDDPAARDSIGR